MDVIGLDCQFDNLPVIFLCHFTGDLLKTVTHRPYQYLFPPLRTEDDMVENVVYRMLFMKIFLTQVEEYSRYNVLRQQFLRFPSPIRNAHSSLERRGLSGRFLVTAVRSLIITQISSTKKTRNNFSTYYTHFSTGLSPNL